ncbi:MAG: hypothetical protein QXK12_06055 [Candidatus Nezhaarchaeales archaeon]
MIYVTIFIFIVWRKYVVFGFIIYYKVRQLTPEEVQRSRDEWVKFRRMTERELHLEEPGGGGVKVIGEYIHCWGAPYTGFLVVEGRDLKAFHDWWHKFRALTRWYVEEIHTVIGEKEELV